MNTLHTPRLTLLPQCAVHADAMFAVLRDPAIYQDENEAPASAEWLRERLARLESRRSPDGSEHWLNWVVRPVDGAALIGYLQATVQVGGPAYIAYVFGSAHWGSGLASEAAAAVLDELGAHYGVTEFLAVLKRDNRRSTRLLERLAFAPAPAAVLAEHPVEPDEVLMTLTREREITLIDAQAHVIVALDVDTEAQARVIVETLGAATSFYKIGLQLLTAAGPGLMRELVAAGKQVFLDLKLFEIPNSVAGAVRAAGAQGVSMVTVHASAGSAVLRAVVEAARPWPELKVLALTVITSLRDVDLREVGVEAGVGAQVHRLARLAEEAGCHGVVASAHEAAALRASLGKQMLIVTPGIQLAGEGASDQARAATPAQAIRAGATHIVLGRSITQVVNPGATFAAVSAEVALACHR